MATKLISIGESVHASIPKTGAVMRALYEKGTDAYQADSQDLTYIKELISSQAENGADYIAVNLDEFGQISPDVPVELMRIYIDLVAKHGKGVPVCIDSSDDKVLIAGLEQWYKSAPAGPKPLVNSIKTYTADAMMPLRSQYDFSFIGLLMTEDATKVSDDAVGELYSLAGELFDKAMAHGFKSDDIFFDTTVFPLSIDLPMEPGKCSYTYRAFETIKRIREDSRMAGVHFSLGISNCCRDLPGRKIGICRAYVAVAMEYGLDAGIVNVNHKYGQSEPDSELLGLVKAYAALDGDMAKLNDAMMLMSQFCQSCR